MRCRLPRCVLLLACLALAGCHRDRAELSGGATPKAAIQQSIALIRAGHFADFVQQALPPADYARLREDWRRDPAGEQLFSNSVRDRANRVLQALAAPGAPTRLNAELLPRLAAAQDKFGDQVLVIVGVGQALLDKRIAASTSLTAEQKQHVQDILAALAPWVRKTGWFDADKARQAIASAAATTRALKLTRVEQLQSADFDAAMHTYARVFAGTEQLLSIYGLSIDDALVSTRVMLLPGAGNEPHRARVRIAYTLAGKPLSAQINMIELDGRWYSQALVNAARAQHARLSTPPVVGDPTLGVD